MSDRVFMRWPTGLKDQVEAKAGEGQVTRFAVDAVTLVLKFDPCPTCGVPRDNGSCWTC